MGFPRPKKHWTIRYMRARLRQMQWQKAHPLDPWLTRDGVEFFRNWLRAGDIMVEFGSGRSTLWFARAIQPGGHIISVEHHEGWHKDVAQRLRSSGLSNYTYCLAEEKPVPYVAAADAELKKHGGLADIILVDGRMRDHCAIWALEHIRPGGMIVVDNVQRYLPHQSNAPTAIAANGQPDGDLWKKFANAVSTWRKHWTSDDVEDTAFFFAPMR